MDAGDKQLDTNGHEESVAWAAWRIRCSERTILYYLKERKLLGVKVGKSWFIDRASIEAHCAKYGIAEPPSSNSKNPELTIQAQAQENAQPVAPTPQAPTQAAPAATATTDAPAPQESRWQSSSDPQEPVTRLKVYTAFTELNKMADPALLKNVDDLCRKRLKELQIGVMEAIGAGYYSNWGEKTNHYLSAKAQIGSMLSLIYSCPELSKELHPYLTKLEQDIIPMLGALIGKLFRSRNNYKKSQYGDNDGGGYNRGRGRWSK